MHLWLLVLSSIDPSPSTILITILVTEGLQHGGKFRPLGIGVRVPSVPFGIWGRVRGWHPDVFYVQEEGFCRSYWRAIRDNFLLKVPLPPWRFAEMVRYCVYLKLYRLNHLLTLSFLFSF